MQKRKNDLNFDKFIKFPMPEKIFNGPKIKVREDGQVFISPSVIKVIKENNEEMWVDFRHSEDYKTIAIKLDGDKSFRFPRGGAMKFKKWKEILQKFGYSIPAVYWMEWNPEENLWLGRLQEASESPDIGRMG